MDNKYTFGMRNLFVSLLFLPFMALAQNQGDDTPLGSGGTKILCNSNEALTSTVSADGKLNFVACSHEGAVLTAISGGGETMSVVPMGSSLTSVPTLPVTYYNAASDSIEAGSTTTVLNLTAHAIRRGDVIIPTSGTAANVGGLFVVDSVTTNTVTLQNPMNATPAAADSVEVMRARLFTNAGGTASRNGIQVTVQENSQASAAGGLLKLIDAASGATDAGVAGLSIRDDSGATKTTTAGDYQGLYTNPKGALYVDYRFGWQSSSADGLLKQEDATVNSGDAGVVPLAQRLDQLATGQTGSNSEYAVPIVDTLSRLYVNPWGAAVTEFSSSCGTATASTADVAIKAAVASNRIYVGAITCASSDADNATNINFKDGATVMAVGGVNQMATTSSGTFTASFNPPLRGTSNTAFNFNTAVSTSSVICCASTFTSPY